ncbi:MAG: FAD-dependent thymidylate synthase, partial [Patescibacteria group bacterium]
MREFLRHLGRIQESKYIKREAERELKEYLTLKSTLENPPEIHLEVRPRGKKTSSARDIAIAAAYQCYAPGITRIKERKSEKAQGVAERTLKGGHHTTRLHPSFMWHVNGVSRGVVHDVFHSFPFYNTEQQSQRYVKA